MIGISGIFIFLYFFLFSFFFLGEKHCTFPITVSDLIVVAFSFMQLKILRVLQISSNASSALSFITNTDLVLGYSIVLDKLLYRELLIQYLTVSIRLSSRKFTDAE